MCRLKPHRPTWLLLIAAVFIQVVCWLGRTFKPRITPSSKRKSLLSHCSLQSTLPTGSHEPDLDLLHGSRGRLDQQANTASVILMDPVFLLGKKKFHQSAQRLSPAGEAGGWKGREREVWNTTVGDHQLEEGVLTKAKEGAKKVSRQGWFRSINKPAWDQLMEK